MTKKFYYTLLLASIVAILVPFSAHSYYYRSIDKVMFQGFEGEGSFVEDPAYVGDCFGYVTLGVLLAAIISEPVRVMYFNETSDDIGVFTLKCCTKPFGILFGGLPWLLKKPFWDFPRWVAGADVSDESASANQPEPVPEVEVPPQLLDTEQVELNETSSVTAQPVISDVIEAAPLPPAKIDIPTILNNIQADTTVIPQVLPITIPQTSAVPPVVPAAPSATQEPKAPVSTPSYQVTPDQSASKTWEGTQIPEWLNKDLSK